MTPSAAAPAPVALPRGDAALWSQPLDTAELARHIAHCRAPIQTTKEHGNRLEQLAAWLFPHLPGISVRDTNVFCVGRTREVDVPLYNDVAVPRALVSLGTPVFVECKNYDRPVGGQEVAWFDHKLIQGGSSAGILLAASGVTGTPEDRSFAHGVIAEALRLPDSRRILVITLDNLAALSTTESLRELIIKKLMNVSTGRSL